MRKHVFRIALIGLTSFAILRYLTDDGRPGKEEVLKEFIAQHPERRVEKVTTEDEVIARSFVFTYRVPNDSQPRQEEWHYVEDPEGIWSRMAAPTSKWRTKDTEKLGKELGSNPRGDSGKAP